MLTDSSSCRAARSGWDRRASIPTKRPCTPRPSAPFAVERHPVTNAQFAEFVADTGYVTVAERPLDPALYPGVAPADLAPGALVFRPTAGPVDLRDWRQWWDWAPGASWRHPFGAGSATDSRTGRTIRWCRSPIPTRRPMRGGRGGGCRPRRSGSTRRAAAATTDLRVGRRRQARRRADGQHLAGPVPVPQRRRAGLGRAPRRSARSRRMVSACST